MKKRIILTLLVMGMCLSSLSTFAKPTSDTISNKSDTKQTVSQAESEVTPESEEEAEPEVTPEPEETANPEVTPEPQETTQPEVTPEPQETTKPEVTPEPQETAKPEKERHDQGKSKVVKEALKERIKQRAEARLEAKEFFRDLKEFFKDADGETKKDILKEIAVLKKELKDLSIGAFVKGLVVDFDKYDGVKPVIEQGRTLVPVRAITETLGAKVEWNEDTKTIIITKDENVIKMQLDNKIANVNGTDVELEVAPTTKNNRTLVPIRFIAESLKLTVDWDEDSQTVVVD